MANIIIKSEDAAKTKIVSESLLEREMILPQKKRLSVSRLEAEKHIQS